MTEAGDGCVAIIPARGGSKRLPRKNIVPVAGRPMLAWVVAAAQGAASVGKDNVFVSTDDSEIADLARSIGAHVIDRPADLAGDFVWTEPVIRHAVTEVEARRSRRIETVVWMNASIPEVRSEDVDRAVRRLREERLREVFAVDGSWRATSAVRAMIRDALEQKSLSVNVGLLALDYLDVHTHEDLAAVERRLKERTR